MITVLIAIAFLAVAIDRPDVPKFIHRTLLGKNPDPSNKDDEE